MIEVIYKDGEFLAKGTFSMGIAGTYENKEYGQGNIHIDLELEELLENWDKEYSWREPLKPVLADVPKDGNSIAKALEDYYNNKEKMVLENEKQINDYFLYQLVTNFVDCGTPFWETEQAILEEYRGKYSEEEYDEMYSDECYDAVDALRDEYEGTPNDGSLKKTDVEQVIRKYFPMFDLNGLLASIKSEYLHFNGAYLIVQFSDGWGREFYCGAYEEFDENLSPTDWHNF